MLPGIICGTQELTYDQICSLQARDVRSLGNAEKAIIFGQGPVDTSRLDPNIPWPYVDLNVFMGGQHTILPKSLSSRRAVPTVCFPGLSHISTLF